jgi:energy-coupling factor transporter ATP-binding protein EcfA2
MPQISLATNERVFITGKTGSGKTYLARYLTQKVKRLVVLDGKGTLGTPEWKLEAWEGNSHKLQGNEPIRLRAVPPLKSDLGSYWDDILETCLRVGNITVYIDELYAVVPPNKQASPVLFACYTRGRETGLGIWASTQRPVWIPLVAMSESEHFFMFRLQLWEDKQRLAAFMGNDVLAQIHDPHGFYYSKAIDDEVSYFTRFNPVETEVERKNVEVEQVPSFGRTRSRRVNLFGR